MLCGFVKFEFYQRDMAFSERYMDVTIRTDGKAKESLTEIYLDIESLCYGCDRMNFYLQN